MIDRLAKKIASLIAVRQVADEDREEIYAYALNILLGESLQALIILLIAFYLNVFIYTLVICIAFAVFRHFAGGPHLSTRWRCFLVSTTEIIILSLLAACPLQKHFLLNLLFGVFLGFLMIIHKWVPGGTEKKPLKDALIRAQLKRRTLIVSVIWLAVSLCLLTQNQTRYVLAIILGALDAMFMITPIGYKLIRVLDEPERKEEGGGLHESL